MTVPCFGMARICRMVGPLEKLASEQSDEGADINYEDVVCACRGFVQLTALPAASSAC